MGGLMSSYKEGGLVFRNLADISKALLAKLW